MRHADVTRELPKSSSHPNRFRRACCLAGNSHQEAGKIDALIFPLYRFTCESKTNIFGKSECSPQSATNSFFHSFFLYCQAPASRVRQRAGTLGYCTGLPIHARPSLRQMMKNFGEGVDGDPLRNLTAKRNEPMEQRIKQYAELITKGQEVEATWLRQVLTIAAGTLALLAGLGPDVPSDGAGKYLLATTWAGLGLGIVAAAAATYIEVNRARTAAIHFGEHLLRIMENQPSSPLISIPPNRIYVISKPVMLVSLLVSVVCLTAYAITTTLAV